jgi:hypothetical protein
MLLLEDGSVPREAVASENTHSPRRGGRAKLCDRQSTRHRADLESSLTPIPDESQQFREVPANVLADLVMQGDIRVSQGGTINRSASVLCGNVPVVFRSHSMDRLGTTCLARLAAIMSPNVSFLSFLRSKPQQARREPGPEATLSRSSSL